MTVDMDKVAAAYDAWVAKQRDQDLNATIMVERVENRSRADRERIERYRAKKLKRRGPEQV